MKTISIPLGSHEVSLPVPEGWQIAGTVRPRHEDGVMDDWMALVSALESPIGTSALKDKDLAAKRIVLCVEDISRPTPTGRFFTPLLKYLLEHGASRSQMLILFGLGVHRPMRQDEAWDKLGTRDLQGIEWKNHDSGDPSQLVTLGTTSRGTTVSLNRHLAEADLIITIGAIEPHLLLGFGGGCKMIIPGLASSQTIARNHMQGVSPERYNYVGMPESPMRLDLEEGAMMLKKEIFIVNAVMNESLEVCRFFVGAPIKAHREGIEFSRSLAERPVHKPVDVVIVASNPMNADLRQGMKCIGNVQESVKPGGLIVSLLECKHGIGDITLPRRSIPNSVLRLVLRVIGRKRVLAFIDWANRRAGIEERFLSHFSAQMVRRNKILVFSPHLPADTGSKLGIFVQYPDVGSMMAAAQRHAPKRAQVLIFPHGGATYPKLSSGK